MAKREYLVVEVLDPASVAGVFNVWVPLDSDENSVRNGFKAMRDSGQTPTGLVTRAERLDDGTVRRIDAFPSMKKFVQGFRTMSAFLRA